MGRSIYESAAFSAEADTHDRRALDEYALFEITWALARHAEQYPLVPETPGWRVIKVDPRPHFPQTRVYFTVDDDSSCTMEALQVDVDVYGEEDSS
jgi:hypothetical protein